MAKRVRTRIPGAAPALLAAGLVLSMTASCASDRGGAITHDPGGTGTGSGLLPQLSIQRTGGFAGLEDTVVVDPRGAWTVANRSGTRTTGQLTAAQVAAIKVLAADPRLVGEAGRTPPPTGCADAIHYVLTVGATRVGYTDCPTDPAPPGASIALVNQTLRFTLLSGRGDSP